MHIGFSIKIREFLRFSIVAFFCYALFILIFAWWYFITDSITLTPYSQKVTETLDFGQAVYFSIVTFHTIGFGDIHPVTDMGRTIVMIQSAISIFFTAMFSGLLVYYVIKRPNDIFSTKKLYIRYRDNCFWLSIRLGNKGRSIIDLDGRFEAWTIDNNSRIRAFQSQRDLPDLEKILYYDINLDDPENFRLRTALTDARNNKFLLHMKFSVIGNDIKTGEQMAFAKYYDSSDLAYGKIFMNVYSWDANGHRKDFQWKNFERIEPLEPELIRTFEQA
ncbi:MAG: potassium channel family protein [Bacteroidetes bacterium]|nr:potassium channel family protein [Bacteroidota bacterium]